MYRDPIHDFGFLKFDPKMIKHMPVTALELHPELAKVGVEIRVVGNDASEKLSILSGVISRLDRNAPKYSSGYNDFNTCYYQASAGATGGSSGSPVVDINGFALALNAAAKRGASTGYFLPLDSPLRALRCLQEGRAIARGDIQCQFYLKPFDECKRLGLSPEREIQARHAFPSGTNMLVAERVLPEGPSHHKIEEGDVLLQANGELITQFIRLEDILDSSVGASIKLLLSRNGEEVEAEIVVGDLHKITPDRFVMVAGASFHDLSYQQARRYGVACRGVYVSDAGGSLLSLEDVDHLIETVDGQKIPNLDVFIEVMKRIPDRDRVAVTYKSLHDLHTVNTAFVYIDRHWSKEMLLVVRNDETGLWDFTNLADPLPPPPLVPRTGSFVQLEHISQPALADLVRSFVYVECTMPLMLDGFPDSQRCGMGLVVDADKGLLVASRAIIPYDLCDVSITIAGSIVVEGKIVFLHPLQNYAVIQYDSKLVEAPVLSAKLSPEDITQGTPTHFIGYKKSSEIVRAATTITQISAFTVPPDSCAPCYKAMNIDTATIDTSLGEQCSSGVLVADDGTVQALWLTFMGERPSADDDRVEYRRGLPTPALLPVIAQIQKGDLPKLRLLCAEFQPIQLFQARIMGVSEEWVNKVPLANRSHHQLFKVSRTFKLGAQDCALLQDGDVLLTLNGKLITKLSELDVMYSHEVLDAVVVRGRKELNLRLATVAADDVETDRAVSFCGATIQQPHHAVRQRMGELVPSGVYVSRYRSGSPADLYKLYPINFISHVNGKSTPDLDTFLAVGVKIPNNEGKGFMVVTLPFFYNSVSSIADKHNFEFL